MICPSVNCFHQSDLSRSLTSSSIQTSTFQIFACQIFTPPTRKLIFFAVYLWQTMKGPPLVSFQKLSFKTALVRLSLRNFQISSGCCPTEQPQFPKSFAGCYHLAYVRGKQGFRNLTKGSSFENY